MPTIDTGQIYLLGPGKREIKPSLIEFHCGSRLPPMPVQPPFAWNQNPFRDNNWQAQLQMWRPMDAHILAFASSKNPAWLIEPQKLIMDWHDYYLVNAPSRYVWADMNVGMRAMKIAWFLALRNSSPGLLDSKFITVCEALRKSHLDCLLDPARQVLSNHAFMDLHGCMALAQTLPENESDKMRLFIHAQLQKLLTSQFDEFGIHRENSPQYQEFVLRYLRRLLASGWFETQKLKDLIAKAENALAWFRLPDGRLAPIGDTDYTSPAPHANKNICFQEEEIFNSSGYVIFRPQKFEDSRDSYLFFMCARHSLTHKHSDDMSVFWHESEDILIDSGKYAYQSSPQRLYVKSTRAHNTLEVDYCDEYSRGRPRRPPAPLTLVEKAVKSDDVFIAISHMIIQEHDLAHRRMVALKPRSWLLVCDMVFSTRPHDYGLHWHFSPRTQIEITNNGINAELFSGRKLFISLHSSIKTDLNLIAGSDSPRLQGFCSDGYGTIISAPCLSLTGRSECWQAATLFSLDKPALLDRVEMGKYRVTENGKSRVFKASSIFPQTLF